MWVVIYENMDENSKSHRHKQNHKGLTKRFTVVTRTPTLTPIWFRWTVFDGFVPVSNILKEVDLVSLRKQCCRYAMHRRVAPSL